MRRDLTKKKLRLISCAQTCIYTIFIHSFGTVLYVCAVRFSFVWRFPPFIYFHVDFVFSVFLSLLPHRLCRIRSNVIREFGDAPHIHSVNVVSLWGLHQKEIYRTNQIYFFVFPFLVFSTSVFCLANNSEPKLETDKIHSSNIYIRKVNKKFLS